MHVTFEAVRGAGVERDYVTQVEGSLHLSIAQDEDGLNEEEIEIGRVSARVICVDEACGEGGDPADAADAIDQQTHDMWCAVIEPGTINFRDFVGDGALGSDVLMVMSIEILPEWRGQLFGLLLLDETIRVHGRGCGAVVLEAAPLRQLSDADREAARLAGDDTDWRERMKWDGLAKTEAEYARVSARLREHWAQLGFELCPTAKRSRFMYRTEGLRYPYVGPAESGFDLVLHDGK